MPRELARLESRQAVWRRPAVREADCELVGIAEFNQAQIVPVGAELDDWLDRHGSEALG